MNSTVDAGQFAAALKKVGSVVPTKSSITELKSVLVEFSADTCQLTGTDLNDWLSVEIPAKGDDFAFTIPYQSNLGRLCKRYSGKLLVDLWGRDGKQKATLACTDKASEFPVNGVGFFPARPSFEAANEYVSNAAELYDRVKSVSYASKHYSTKPELDGIRFEGNHVWCLDGQRMAVSDDKKLHVQDRFILSAQSLEYLKLFGNGSLRIRVSEQYVKFVGKDSNLLCRRLKSEDGLSVETILNPLSKESYTVDRKRFADAIAYMLDCSEGMPKPFAVCRDGYLMCWNGEAAYRAKVEMDRNCEHAFAFDLRYVRDALRQFSKQKTIRIQTASDCSPIVLTSDCGETALVLPVRQHGSWTRNAA